MTNLFKQLPNMNVLLQDLEKVPRYQNLPNTLIKQIATNTLEVLRQEIMSNQIESIDYELIMTRIKKDIDTLFEYQIKRCINATGTIIHTNLGRSNLSSQVINHLKVAQGYNTLEYNTDNRSRGNRNDHFKTLLNQLTGAQDCVIVNNNAAAVFLVLNALAKNQEVIVSRGELVEIGGSFRISSIMQEAGCTLKEVGTTNKTHLYDYENTINDNTRMLLKVHQSNFRITGFTSSIDAKTLASIKNNYPQELIIYEDLASGALIDYSQFGLEKEPMIQDSIANGVDIVSFSADKLLGGCQAGIIVGKQKYIDIIKKHPLNRCLRCGSLTLIALEATLKSYLVPTVAINQIPTLKMISQTHNIKQQNVQLLSDLLNLEKIIHTVVESKATVGGGTMPTSQIDSYAIAIQFDKPQDVLNKLSKFDTPIIVRVENDAILLDITTIDTNDYTYIVKKLSEVY